MNWPRPWLGTLYEVCLFSFLFINSAKYSASESCNNGLDLCQPLGDCDVYLRRPKPISQIKWCDRENSIACCPQVRMSLPTEAPEKPYEKDCVRWRETFNKKCDPTPLIVGGKLAEPYEFPHMALIGTKNDTNANWFCAGSLISPRYVITAAHCMEQNPEYVRLGDFDYNSTLDDEHVQEFRIKSAIDHPDYNPFEHYYDISLIELDGTVTLSQYVVPICLPKTNGSEHNRLYAAGWGVLGTSNKLSSRLNKVVLERFSDEQCKIRVHVSDELSNGLIPTHQICAGSNIDNRDSCNGDSGGSLFIEHKFLPCMYELQGITSFGAGCGIMGSPTVYSRIFQYLDWIEGIVWNGKH